METVGFAFGPIVKWLFEELQFLVLGFIFSVLKVATCFSHTNTPTNMHSNDAVHYRWLSIQLISSDEERTVQLD